MESLSTVRTIMGITQDIVAVLETASRNKSRCHKVAKRVRCIKDILAALDAAAPDDRTTTTTDAATRSLLDRLEEALSRALQVVRRCQRGSFFRSVIIVAGGRKADPLDEVEAEIDRCILDLAVANSLRIARLETLLVRRQYSNNMEDGENDGENQRKGSAAEGGIPEKQKADDLQVPIGSGAKMNHDKNTTATEEITAIGVPVCTVTAAAVHEHRHEMVLPPCYGYGYAGYRRYGGYCRNHGCACDSWDDGNAGQPSDAAAFYNTQYSSCPSMFSDDNPNSCSIS